MTLAHQGAKEYRQKYELIYRRESTGPNQVWQIDHSLLDILLVESALKFKKPWLTVVIDDYSRAICGYFLSFEDPSAINTALCLRQAIWKKGNPSWPVCGIPQILYTDHGTDFMSDHIQQVCIALKIRMINSMVGRPQGRGKIERFFETVNECVLCGLPGYLSKGKAVSKPALDLSQLSHIIEGFITNQYHHQVHSTINQTPLERWDTGGFLPQIPESLDLLDGLLLSVDKSRKVQRDGIRFHGFRYISTILAGFVGEMVSIQYDPRDLAEIKVYYQDRFLCRCICQDIAGMVISLKEIQRARKEVKQGLYDHIRRAKLLINAVQKGRSSADSKKDDKSKKTKNIVNLKLYHND
jgi:putative transposase